MLSSGWSTAAAAVVVVVVAVVRCKALVFLEGGQYTNTWQSQSHSGFSQFTQQGNSPAELRRMMSVTCCIAVYSTEH